jgi:hypothetical protein
MSEPTAQIKKRRVGYAQKGQSKDDESMVDTILSILKIFQNVEIQAPFTSEKNILTFLGIAVNDTC